MSEGGRFLNQYMLDVVGPPSKPWQPSQGSNEKQKEALEKDEKKNVKGFYQGFEIKA